ncbi:hypothetical protein CLG96_07770 [Sphingomonas oleivorans]|uniref:Cytochrome c domain-containing protein n=2 Tax=Sphingomonas oleivorans TaxID=1735121 RepID=A0A2T5FZ57_9SPHN|nr:hypothetical protein CLG96_07770 [Sphingomonas oleivorans]
MLGALAVPFPASVAIGQASDGATLFKRQCGVCHSKTVGARSGMGPNLAGVVGRNAGSVANFAYSPALKAYAKPWSRDELDRFLSGPFKAVPGTRMTVTVRDANQRAALIDYLSTP